MSSLGIDMRTGKTLTGWQHVLQSLEIIFTTPIGSRVMRRAFGSAIPALLGRPMNNRTILAFATAIVVAVELWEPCFRIKQVYFARRDSATGEPVNTPEKMRLGALAMTLVGEYRPRGHLGDPTPEGGERTIEL